MRKYLYVKQKILVFIRQLKNKIFELIQCLEIKETHLQHTPLSFNTFFQSLLCLYNQRSGRYFLNFNP